MTTILNRSSNQSCGACEDTGLIVLGGTYRVGRREMQPQATGCRWCEAGNEKFRLHEGLTRDYGIDDIDAPSAEPDLTDPRTRKACQTAFEEWQRAYRSMRKAQIERDDELAKGARETPSSAPRATIPP